MRTKLTQHQKLVSMMCRHDHWWLPYDFMPPRMDFSNPYCVGYEANSRLSELRKDYPKMIQTRREGRYKASRIDRTTVHEWFNDLPKDLKQVVALELDYYPHIPGNRYEA